MNVTGSKTILHVEVWQKTRQLVDRIVNNDKGEDGTRRGHIVTFSNKSEQFDWFWIESNLMRNVDHSHVSMWLLLLVWQAPLGVRSAKQRHQSPERTILSHGYRLIQWEIVRPQVLLDSLHPRSSRTSWWFPPVLRRGSSSDTPGICLVWHSCNMAEQRKTATFKSTGGRSGSKLWVFPLE